MLSVVLRRDDFRSDPSDQSQGRRATPQCGPRRPAEQVRGENGGRPCTEIHAASRGFVFGHSALPGVPREFNRGGLFYSRLRLWGFGGFSLGGRFCSFGFLWHKWLTFSCDNQAFVAARSGQLLFFSVRSPADSGA